MTRKSDTESNPQSQIVQRLNVIVNLLLEGNTANERLLGDKVVLLRGMGLSNIDIAQILGLSNKRIGNELSKANKKITGGRKK